MEIKRKRFQDLKAWYIHTWFSLCQIDLVSIMSPRSKFQLACLHISRDERVRRCNFSTWTYHLVIEWKPSDINSASWLKNARRNLLTLAGAPHHDVCREGGIEVLIGTVVKKNVWLPHFDWRNPNILTKYILKISNILWLRLYMDSSVLSGVPHKTIVLPVERKPDVARQDLILFVQINNLLQTIKTHFELNSFSVCSL